MNEGRYRVESLTGGYDRTTFSCGNEELDRYLRTQAGQDQRRNVSRVFLLIDEGDDRIVGYYTLSASSIELSQLPDEVRRRLPSYPQCPAILLGRLAVDKSLQGQGAGAALLVDALGRCLDAAREIGAFAVTVDAIDDGARAFYQHHEFISLLDTTKRLFLPLATIRKMFDDSSSR